MMESTMKKVSPMNLSLCKDLHICYPCIQNVVFYFFAMPQIMSINMWVSMSSLNTDQHFWPKGRCHKQPRGGGVPIWRPSGAKC